MTYVSADNIVQMKTGDFNSSTGSAFLDATVADGSTVVICANIADKAPLLSDNWDVLPDDTDFDTFVLGDVLSTATNKPQMFAKRNVSGESSWPLTVHKSGTPTAGQVLWAAFEVTGVGLDQLGNPNAKFYVHTVNINGSNSNTATRSTGNTDPTPCYSSLVFSVFGSTRQDGTTPALTGHTNDFSEIASISRVDGSVASCLSVAVKAVTITESFESTVSVSPSSPCWAGAAALFADGAKYSPIIDVIFGGEIGLTTGLANGSDLQTGTAPFDVVNGSPEIVSTNARSGSFCLKLSSVAAAENVGWTNPGVLSANNPVSSYPALERLNIYFDGALPSSDLPLYSVEVGSAANGGVLWYRSASQKLGLKVGTGTEILSDAVIGHSVHIGVDHRYMAHDDVHVWDWAVDYNSNDVTPAVVQPQAVGAGTTAGLITAIYHGWKDARTATVYMDDLVFSKQWGLFPMGDYKIDLLKPAGTPSIIGTVGNFRLVTGGGTLSTWTAAGTITTLDDAPPLTGGTFDGVAQITLAANDYVQVPVEPWDGAPDNTPRAARWYLLGWAASGTAATCGAKFLDVEDTFDGTVPPIIVTGDHGLDATTVKWLCRMHRSAGDDFYQLTPARAKALRCRFGGSTDATPDVAVGCVLVELAYQSAEARIIYENGAGFTVYGKYDRLSDAIVGLLATTPTGTKGALLTWTHNSVDGSHYVGPNDVWEEPLDSDDIRNVTAVGYFIDSS